MSLAPCFRPLAQENVLELRLQAAPTSGAGLGPWQGLEGESPLVETSPVDPVTGNSGLGSGMEACKAGAFTSRPFRFRGGILPYQCPTGSQVWEEQPVVRPSVLTLDSENVIPVDTMQRVCTLASEDRLRGPSTWAKSTSPLSLVPL